MKMIFPTCLMKQHLLRPVEIWLTMLPTVVVLYLTPQIVWNARAFNAYAILKDVVFLFEN